MHTVIETNEARRPWGLAAFLVLALAAFVALGIWQVERLQWKHALIARVDARVHAEPIPLPADDRLARVKGSDLDYLRVSLQGSYAGSATVLVRAATDLGTGYWTMTPLKLEDGRQVWVNRGFVPAGTSARAAAASTPPGAVRVVGLLRSDEPGGSLLQSNQPQADRWYSRDTAVMAKARGIGRVVPAFVDAQVEQANRPKGLSPVPGLTQIHFPDNHLSYALTWFALAAMSAMALVFVWRRRRWNG